MVVLSLFLAYASGLDVPAVGTALSGASRADAAAVYWNPANLARLERGEVLLSGGAVGGRVAYQRNRLGDYQLADTLQFSDPIDPAYLDPSRSGEAEPVAAWPASPWANGFFAVPVGDFGFGGGFFVPYAAPLAFPDDGAQRFQLQRALILVSQVTAAASWQPMEAFSVGLSVSYVSGLGALSRVQDFAGLDTFGDGLSSPPISQDNSFGADAPTTVRELDVLARPFTLTDGLSHGIDASVGIAVRPTEDVWLGATYHHGSRAVFRGDFALNMDDDFFTQDLAAQGLEFPPLVTGDASLAFRLPGRVLLGGDWQISETVGLEVDLAWVWWRQLRTFDLELSSADLEQPELGIPSTLTTSLPRDWNDSVHVEVSPRGQLGPVLLVGTAGYHSPASPDATIDVASPDGHRLIGALGGRIDPGERLGLMAEFEAQGILPRTVTESDHDLGNGRYGLLLAHLGLHAIIKL